MGRSVKNDTDDGSNLCSIERPRQIKSRFSSNTWYPERSVKSSRSNDTPTGRTWKVEDGITIRLSLLDESRVPLIAANLPTDVLIEGVRSRNAHTRSSSIMSASVRAQSSALCARHCSPFHRATVSCPRMNRDARLRVTNRKAILRLFIAATPLYLSSWTRETQSQKLFISVIQFQCWGTELCGIKVKA